MNYGVLPADRYKVINRTILSEVDKENLLYFYAPVIGPIAVYLYLLLWQDLQKEDESKVYIHHRLMNILKCNAKTLKEAREALEAVGLIKTFVREGNVLEYIYELYSPLSASEFFAHPILNTVLHNALGDEEYKNLEKKYTKKKYNHDGFIEITKKMDEVFKVENTVSSSNIKEKINGETKLTSSIDYDLILDSIPKNTLSDKAFNKRTRELIDNLSFIYNLDTLKMIELIRKSINEFGMIDKDELRTSAQKYYELSSGSLPTIVYRTQPEYLKKASGDTTLRGKIIAMFENISPYDF